MRRLSAPSRRRFGQGLGASLALAALPWPAAARDADHVVRIARFAFLPARLEIAAGETVAWINEDLAPHTATARDGTWGTEDLREGEMARHVFDAPGTFDYLCAFHPHMRGSVTVRAAAG